MSKLDGNERWKSKMLLTEHQEQYEARNDKPMSQRQTQEERFLVRDYVVLPHMLTMADNSQKTNSSSANPLKSVIDLFLQTLMDRISGEIQKTVRELNRRNIKVNQDEHFDDVYYFQVRCRGFVEKVGFTREVMKSEIRVKMNKFSEEMLSPSKKSI
ncbi:hypothetical protein [Cohnella sp. AR92]|uniref:hypothetical protein n=1 Tax=Cohnella sp. AR92 TaxID=648716 RepID=UPI000F8D4307|nr:hypothetical protein [Cohnella sp. AR92]RUS44960.1 hypothetical protein ELR57_22145 [Cohnella sp. AR92]